MQDNRYSPNPRKYYKSNYVDAVELITPKVYQQEDLALSGTEVNPLSLVINSNIRAAANISDVLSISGVSNSQTSSLGNISGISQYFVKQNNLTRVNPYILEHKILLPLGTSFSDYNTSGDFNNYLSGTLLPNLIPAQQKASTGSPSHSIGILSALNGSTDPSSIHNYLVDALGWFYFLNTSADGGLDYSPSSYVLSSLNTLYTGNSLETIDGVKGFVEYIWRNYQTCSTFRSLDLIPATFVSGITDGRTETSAGPLPTYTSGTQKLSKLQTLVDVIYSPLFIDKQDYTVKDAFDNYMDASIQLSDRTSKGPFRKFSNLLGFEFADISNEVDNLGLIYDIENSKDENLQYIAQLIGWKLRGNSADAWRHQLRQSVDLYKKSGTMESIQAALNLLVTDSVLDVSAATSELWESYLPYMIWYALGTESPLFRNLNTWSFGLAQQAGLTAYNTSSLEANIHMVVDDILLQLYKAFPHNFIFGGERFPVPHLINIDERGQVSSVYTIIGEPRMKPFHAHIITEPGYQTARREAYRGGHKIAWDSAISLGPLGSGVYMQGLEHPNYALGEAPLFLSATGDLEFTFNYRDKMNYPLPPFEEVKYYRDSNLSVPLLELLAEQLTCYQVKKSFVSDFQSYVLSSGINTDTNLGSLNEMLMFFSSVQVPPNFDNVMLDISNYEKNLLDLWNGKSSHIFVDFSSSDFDFSQDTLEADGKNALYEASRITREFSPAHTIPRVNLNAEASDSWAASSTNWTYLGFDEDGTRVSYASASILGNFEYSGVKMGSVAPGTSNGRGGLNTFKRADVDKITDNLLDSTTAAPLNNVGRRALRRRNLRYLLPKEGYYDRTGFNGPVTYDPSVLENSMPSSMGELTLGYVPSAGQFFPVVDAATPSGVWNICENLESEHVFSGVTSKDTFPFRGTSGLRSNYFSSPSSTDRYVDRDQLPLIYNTMHQLFEQKALDYAAQETDFDSSSYLTNVDWKNQLQSLANSAIADGLVLNSYEDYINFNFGRGIQETYSDYNKYFGGHPLSRTSIDDTGGSIFAQVFGKGLFNCDFDIAGSAVGNMVSHTVNSVSAINSANIWNTTAAGTYIAQGTGRGVVPLSGTFIEGNPNNAEYRNPYILSGIEFTDISGAPPSNQFTIFKLDSSNAVRGGENPLINNSVIKCKSLGGLPRLRFDLSSYGDRPNRFIKDHKFNLKVKALVGEENSSLLGGGRLAAWIHTQPNPRPNPNLLSYTENSEMYLGADWQRDSDIGTVSSVAITNPFGGPSSLIMSAGPGADNYNGVAALSSMPRMPTFHADKTVAVSFFVKRPDTNYVSGFMIDLVNTDTDSVYDDHTIQFKWDGTVPILRTTESDVENYDIQDFGDGWYRIIMEVRGLHGTEVNGEAMRAWFFLGTTQHAAATTELLGLYVWGFQLEQYYTDGNYQPSPYEAVTGLVPDPLTTNNYMWCWTPRNKWEFIKQDDLSISKVLSLSHIHNFGSYDAASDDEDNPFCLNNIISEKEGQNNDLTLLNIRDSYFETFEVDFDTRNFTINNNFEYLDIIPIPEDIYKITNQVNQDDTNYVIELFFAPNSDPNKYMLIDSVALQDVTQRENAAIGTGHGIETSGIPNRRFVKEDKLHLTKTQLWNTLKFYNGLTGKDAGIYTTNLASRDATITSGIMEVSGGSRLNYRIAPAWTVDYAKQDDYNNTTNVELDN